MGEVLDHRYQVTAKLGCGAHSTVWLARDLWYWRWRPDVYVAIQVSVTGDTDEAGAGPEEPVKLQHISAANRRHPGRDLVSIILDNFHLKGPACQHLCMVFEPLRELLGLIKYKFTTEMISVPLPKVVARQVLQALDYLHNECHIIHCDLSESNIIFNFAEKYRHSILDQHSKDERTDSLPVKRLTDRVIYLPHNDFGPLVPHIGAAIVLDFDSSVRGDSDEDRNHDIQPQGLTAPEVMLRAGWSYSADVWIFGALICGLMGGEPLFDDANRKHWQEFSEPLSMARMIAFMGPPPTELLERSARLANFFEGDVFKFPQLVPEDCSFDTFFARVEGDEKEEFVAFAKRMFTWLPENRATAAELLADPWLRRDR
ncbi:hypothetical protein LTR78_010804 [Recurvomyces mirabilis]|uniref:EKC/KEOPS complex subunit BUD32 n=2 Tax=Recurvomyces mirabilis TaxID=574656 RepID=A0AAE0TMB6_9PEZI|nr:hypothetical protein LTR78_010804 [Recurvomyces mirabilis]